MIKKGEIGRNLEFVMNRNLSLDGLKYVLIFLVVLGHLIEPSRYDNKVSELLYSFIYSFHMPLFIWMNGYFYKHRKMIEEFRRCLPLIEVCVISHIGFALLRDGELSISNMFFFNYSPSWYLLSLCFWRMMSSWLFKFFDVRKLLIYAIIVEFVSFILIHKYGGFLSLMRTLQFYPYFVSGYILQNKLECLNRKVKIILQLGGVVAAVFILLTSSRLQHQIDFQRAGLFELQSLTNHSIMELLAFRYAVIVSSLMMSVMVLCWALNNNFIKKMAIYGKNTLFIYFSQTLIYAVLSRYNLLFYQSVLLTILVVPLLTYVSIKDFSKFMMNPISSLIKKYK